MKKLLFLLVVAAAPLGAQAGFVGPSEQAVLTVSEVKNIGDDRAVVMKGTIEKHIKKDKYQFVDSTGKIVVEIDGETWRGMEVTPQDTVVIIGETEKDWMRPVKVDVESIEIIKN